MSTEIWIDAAGAPLKARVEALNAEVAAALREGVPIEDIWIVEPPTKWRIVDDPDPWHSR